MTTDDRAYAHGYCHGVIAGLNAATEIVCEQWATHTNPAAMAALITTMNALTNHLTAATISHINAEKTITPPPQELLQQWN